MREQVSAARRLHFSAAPKAAASMAASTRSLCPAKWRRAVSRTCEPAEKWMKPSATSTGAPVKTPAASAAAQAERGLIL